MGCNNQLTTSIRVRVDNMIEEQNKRFSAD